MREDSKDNKGKEFCKIHISKFVAYADQPFKVIFDESMNELAESIRQNGVLTPVIARPIEEDLYEIIAGHRRIEACKLARVIKIPTIVRCLDDDTAAIMLVDSNLQRERILPSEKARAYKLKLDALKNQGKRADLTSSQFGTKLRADEKVASDAGESRNQIHRFIRLNNLVDQLLDLVDEGSIPINAAVELSYLGTKAQADIADIIFRDEMPVSLKQASRIRSLSKDGKISFGVIEAILTEEPPEKLNITLGENRLRRYFPVEYSKKQIESIVMKLIKKWHEENRREIVTE